MIFLMWTHHVSRTRKTEWKSSCSKAPSTDFLLTSAREEQESSSPGFLLTDILGPQDQVVGENKTKY
jgi:hypothetical protein